MICIQNFNYLLLPMMGFIIGYNYYNFTNFLFTGLITFYNFSVIKFEYYLCLDRFIISYMVGVTLQTIEYLPIFSGCFFGLFLITGLNDEKQYKIIDFLKNIDTHSLDFINLNCLINIISNLKSHTSRFNLYIFKKKNEDIIEETDEIEEFEEIDDPALMNAYFSDDESITSSLEASSSSLNLNYII